MATPKTVMVTTSEPHHYAVSVRGMHRRVFPGAAQLSQAVADKIDAALAKRKDDPDLSVKKILDGLTKIAKAGDPDVAAAEATAAALERGQTPSDTEVTP